MLKLSAQEPIQLLGTRAHLGLQLRPPRTARLERGCALHLVEAVVLVVVVVLRLLLY